MGDEGQSANQHRDIVGDLPHVHRAGPAADCPSHRLIHASLAASRAAGNSLGAGPGEAQLRLLSGSFSVPQAALQRYCLLFDLSLDDADAGDFGRRTQVVWSGAEQNYQNADGYGVLALP